MVSHPMLEHVDKFNSSVGIKLHHLSLTAINHAGRVEIKVPLVFESAVDYIIEDYFLSSVVSKIVHALSM